MVPTSQGKMVDEKWQKVREVFDSALRHKPEERRSFIHQACGEDKTLLAEVESLLSSLDSAESFMETPAVAEVAGMIEIETKKLEAGKCFGHYEIIKQIGVGGMGEVYLARDKKLDRQVAVKILNEKLSSDNANLQRFIREAKAASALNHPNILVIHEIGGSPNAHFIVSEHIKGKTLREILKEESLELSEILDVAVQIAGALVAAHEAHLVHRDIKPENIMIRPDGVVKVLDFGLAKLVEQKIKSVLGLEDSTMQQNPTAKGVILGTVAYMSPEQTRGERVDARTDIFSFGTLLYEMLTKEQPFTGETTNHTIVAILEKEPPPLSQFIRSYPPEIERIIKTCLAKQADERYSAAKVLLDDLKELKEELAFQSKLERSSAPSKKAEAKAQIIRAATIAETEKRNSIAVLPFTNMSAEAENEYFCDGLAEELLNALAKIEALKVAARTSAFSFKNKNVEISEIGRTLNVKTVLEGSVRKSGNRLRISVQLVNTADGYHLWSEIYDREMRDLFDVEDEITLAVVDALKVKLLGEETAAILKRYTDDPEAYELYLKGLYHSYKWTDEGFRKSIEYFEKALEKDPEFAPAYAKIADYYTFSSHIGLFSPHEIFPKWKAAAQRALEIDEGLDDAHLAMAHIYFYYERDWAKAEREFERAVKLNPNSAQAHKHYGQFLASREQFERAVSEVRKALDLDPLSIAVNFVVGATHFFVDRLDDARGFVRRLTELDSNSPHACWLDGYLLMANGEYEEAVEAFQKSLDLGDNQIALSELGCAYGLVGRRAEALKILDQLLEMREKQYAAAFNIARVYAGLGDNDNAFRWMEKAIEERNGELVFLRRFVKAGAGVYLGKTFSTDSRYEDILSRAGLPLDRIALESRASSQQEEAKTQVFNATTSDIAPHTTSSAEYIVNSIKHHKRLAVLGLVPLVIASIVFLFLFNRSPVLTEKDTILLADFVNTTGDAVFDLTMRQALAVQLGQTPFLNIYPDDRIQETLRLMNRKPDDRITKDVAREISERNGIKAMLLGSIASLGNNYVITLEALSPRTGEALAREQIEAAGKEQVLGKLGDAAKKLREKLGESLQTIEKFDTSIEQATTSSLEALKAFSIGQQLQMAGKANESIPFHKRAIELDPNFGSAYKNLGEAYFFTGQRDRAAESFTKAFELRGRVSERERFTISSNYYQHVVGDVDKTVETLELWKQTYPREWQPRSNLASLYNTFMLGQYEKAAEEAQEAIRLYPHAIPYYQLAYAFAKLNRFEEAKATFEESLARGQDSIFVRTEIYRIAFIQGDRAKMQQQIDWARGTPNEERMHYEEGRMAMFNGQVSRAEKSFRRRNELAQQRSAKDAMSLTDAEFAFWNSFFGNCKESKKSVADALATLRGEEALNLSGVALAVCGEIGQAKSIADEIAKRKSKDVTTISFLPEMRAAIEISRNNQAKAVEILESTRILERGFGIPGRTTYLRGIAYLRQNAGKEAMNEFQKILDRRGHFDTSPFFPLAQLGLARAAAIAGDTTKSRRRYQDFFALWKDADVDIPILIEAKKEYEKLK